MKGIEGLEGKASHFFIFLPSCLSFFQYRVYLLIEGRTAEKTRLFYFENGWEAYSKAILTTVTPSSNFRIGMFQFQDNPKHIFLELNYQKNHRSNSDNSKPRQCMYSGGMKQRLHHLSIGKESLNT